MSTLVPILITAFFFYGFIPVLGAFVVRSQWRRVRKNLHSSLYYPMDFHMPESREAHLGPFRVLGELEAIEGNDTLWIKTGQNRTVTVDMRDSHVYFMPAFAGKEKFYPHLSPVPFPVESLEKVSWNQVFSMPEGTKMYISGQLDYKDGRFHFRTGECAPLMVLVYNENPRFLIPRAVWCGRQSNEFWNFLTPWSLVSGILILLIQSVYLLQNSGNYFLQFFCISMALIPALLFLPPGVFLFNLYRRAWDIARRFRAERDLIRLSINPETGNLTVWDGDEPCAVKRSPSGWGYGIQDSEKEVRVNLGCLEGTVCLPGDPEELSSYCRKKAFLYESLSGILVLAGLIINYIVVWILFTRFF